MKRLESIVDMTREDFFRSAHSCTLGHSKKAAHGNSKANKADEANANNNIVQGLDSKETVWLEFGLKKMA